MKSLFKAYQSLIAFGNSLQSPLLLLCRLYWGGLFAMGGWDKIMEIGHVQQFFAQHHLPAPLFLAWLVGLTECLGGICLVLGFAARLAAVPLIIIMLTAYVTVHTASLYQLDLFVAEAPFNFLLASLLILSFGPGNLSLDRFLGIEIKENRKPNLP